MINKQSKKISWGVGDQFEHTLGSFIMKLLSLGEGDNQVETVGGKKLGIDLIKWMGEDKDVYRRKRRGCVGYVLSICCSKRGNHPFLTPVFPSPQLVA